MIADVSGNHQLFVCSLFISDEVRHTFDLMKFYEQTESHIIYVTTHDAVMAALQALHQGLN